MTRLPKLAIATLCASLSLAASSSSQDESTSMASHRAVYNLTLDHSRISASVKALQGRLVWQQENGCEGLSTTQRMVTKQWAGAGEGALFDLRLSAWESNDGQQMNFAQSFYLNEELIDESTGTASLGPKGGEIIFEGKAANSVKLAGRTMFPATLTTRVLNVAKQGGTRFSAVLFEGDSEGEIFDVHVAIGDLRISERKGPLTQGHPSWPVLLSYYVPGDKSELPVYEVSYTLYDNGISDHVVIDYGDYAIETELELLEVLPEPKC